jgi:hypothetical protein
MGGRWSCPIPTISGQCCRQKRRLEEAGWLRKLVCPAPGRQNSEGEDQNRKLENRWQTTTRSLHASGLIKGASACHISTDRVQLRPVLRVEFRFNSPTQLLYTPNFQLLSPEGELHAVRRFLNTSYFTNGATSSGTRLSLADVTARYKVGTTADPGTRGTPWCIAVLMSVITTSCLFAAYQLLCYVWRRIRKPRDHSTPQPGSEVDTSTTLPAESSETSKAPEETTEPTPTAQFLKHVNYAPQAE